MYSNNNCYLLLDKYIIIINLHSIVIIIGTYVDFMNVNIANLKVL